jgi:thiol:disulfide interchange protein
MPNFLKLIIGFILLPVGVFLTLILIPEFGVPLILISTRFLQVRFKWARTFNIWVDNKYGEFKIWFKKKFGKGENKL